ncbi:MAG: hypothetical protein PHT07_03470 [Paludibacter sp.]|nr:hypothetical protein [Paludibacter sp.]
MSKIFYVIILIFSLTYFNAEATIIDRKALVSRNNPQINSFDSLSSLSVGNGEFAFTVDATGLQTFPQKYTTGVPLGTQSQWGWHSFANPNNYRHEETLKNYNFRGKVEPYSTQFNEPGRPKEASEWFRINSHRLHLGIVGFELSDPKDFKAITELHQHLDLWNGEIASKFNLNGKAVSVQTSCHPTDDMICVRIQSVTHTGIKFHFPYPSGGHTDDACDWDSNNKHSTSLVEQTENSALLERKVDETIYYVKISWEGKAKLIEKEKNYFVLQPTSDDFSFTASFTPIKPGEKVQPTVSETMLASEKYWNSFWTTGGAIDFSACKDKRAPELERRVVLSQYLLAIQCAGSVPPQETGLTYNSWYGKFHLEMIWWHEAQFALWGRSALLERTLEWYKKALPIAKEIAQRQGFEGVRWMKMTDPSGIEAPSKVGSFLIWQQPHIIYMAELVYRSHPSTEVLQKYGELIEESAKFMYSFATYDQKNGRFILKGAIPAQETLRASETTNPPFELSYWHFAMSTAQKWRERTGKKRNPQWDELINKLSPLAAKDGLYLAAETATDTYKDIRFTSDHMAVLGAYGILPKCSLVRSDYMQNTLNWIWTNWNWDKTWGWDFPMTAMNAARLGDTEKAVGALLMDKRTNTYLPNGHNYQDSRLRIYLPGNGGLLTAVAMMCAGWDGNKLKNPGFPNDGNWDVKWEGLAPLP